MVKIRSRQFWKDPRSGRIYYVHSLGVGPTRGQVHCTVQGESTYRPFTRTCLSQSRFEKFELMKEAPGRLEEVLGALLRMHSEGIDGGGDETECESEAG